MSNRGWYQGDGIGLVDDKGRVSIPAVLRQTLSANYPKAGGKDGGTIVVGMHEEAECLIAYDPGYLDVLAERLQARESAHLRGNGAPDYNIKRDQVQGEPVPFDGSGRFILPPWPIEYAGITGHAFFYGLLDHIEIWDPRRLVETSDYSDKIKRMVRFQMKQKGVLL